MLTSWSDMILQYIYDGYTYDDIIGYFNHPAVNAEYIDTVVVENKKLLKKKYTRVTPPRTNVPKEGTHLRKLYDFAMSLGGIDKYQELLKTKTLVQIAKELELPIGASIGFKRDFIVGRNERLAHLGGAPSMTMKIRAEEVRKGNYTPKKTRVSLKDVRNLW